MLTTRRLITAVLILILTSACDNDRMSEHGFRLPDGNASAGREAFLYMHCTQCHTVDGDSFPIEAPFDDPDGELGGSVTRVKTYGQLVTAIINPSHKLADGYPADLVSEDGESNMYVYNGYMTIQELIDIVAYLQPFYEVIAPDYRYLLYQ